MGHREHAVPNGLLQPLVLHSRGPQLCTSPWPSTVTPGSMSWPTAAHKGGPAGSKPSTSYAVYPSSSTASQEAASSRHSQALHPHHVGAEGKAGSLDPAQYSHSSATPPLPYLQPASSTPLSMRECSRITRRGLNSSSTHLSSQQPCSKSLLHSSGLRAQGSRASLSSSSAWPANPLSMPWNVAHTAKSMEQTRLEMQILASQFDGNAAVPGAPYLKASAGGSGPCHVMYCVHLCCTRLKQQSG